MLTSGKGPDTTLFPEGSNRTINVETSYGGITRDANGKITGAKAIAMTYLLDEKPSYTTERYAAEAWEDQLNLLIGPSPNGELWSYPDLSEGSVGHWEGAKTPTLTRGGLQWESTLIDIFPQTSGATSRELGKNIRGDLLAVQISFFIIMIYAIFIFSRCHPVKSRVLLAISGCASVGLSIAVAYGFTALLGFKLNPVVQVLPFVLIGIGVDDMFVLTAALEAQPTDLPVKERMARAMGSAGVSITITSLTDLFAFALGATSALPALSTFCVFAAIGITADFLLQISFFAGFMAWDAYREKKRKVDCCPCCLPKGTDAENGCCCFGCCFGMFNCVKAVKGGYCAKIPGLNMIMTLMVRTQQQQHTHARTQQPNSSVHPYLLPCTHHTLTHPFTLHTQVVGLKAWMVNYYIPLMRNKFCKGTVILAFTAFTGLSAAYASQLKQDFQFRWFVNDDAPLQQAFDVQDDYFALSGLPVYVVTPSSSDFEYHTIAGQQKLLSMSAAIDGNRWIEADSVSDWYPMFREWVHACGTTETFDAGPLSGTSCVRKDCSYTYGGVTRYIYPYCTSEKELRDAGGNNLVDANGFDINGAAEAKTMVLSDGATAAAPGAALETSFIPPAKFWKWLDQFLADAPLGAITASEIVWLSNSTSRTPAQIAQGISATRIRATYIATDKADDQVASMVDLRADVTAVGLGDSFPYMFMYLYYEQYAIILREALTNLGLALVAVTIIVTLVLANFTATLLVMLCVVLVDCDILGLMQVHILARTWRNHAHTHPSHTLLPSLHGLLQMWGLTIDSVAIINLVLAIGLAVDYSCHIAHSFLQTKGTRQERVDHALEEMGTAVVHGAFSTFLAVLVLSASKSYIFRIFFKQFFGICVFGAAHGLVLLPTLLSLIGPAYVEFKDDDTKEDDLKGVDIPEVGSTPPSAPPSAPGSECGDRDNYRSMITPRSISPAKVVPSTAF